MPLNETVVEAVANSNFKTLAEIVATNAAGHQQRLQILAEKSLGITLENMDALSVQEGLGISAAQRGDLAKVTSELGSVTASLQQLIKGAQTTPPVTVPQPAAAAQSTT